MSNRKYVGDEVTESRWENVYDIRKRKGVDGMNYMDRTLFSQVTKSSEMPVLVAFCASDCGYCRRIMPALKRLAHQNRGSLGVGVLDISMEPELFRVEQIEALPTLVLYRDGEVLGSIVGPDSGDVIEEFLEEILIE